MKLLNRVMPSSRENTPAPGLRDIGDGDLTDVDTLDHEQYVPAA